MGRMKSAYVICALLGLTIGTLTLADNGVAQPEIKINSTSSSTAEPSKDPEKTTAVPLSISTGSNTLITVTSTVPAVTTATPTNATTTSTIIPTTPSTTTTSTTSTTTPLPPPKTTSHTTPSPITSAPKTTAVPTTAPSSHKDREFDGLSFFGGIVLTTCLMAIAAFSWRFYKQCKDGSYRTL